MPLYVAILRQREPLMVIHVQPHVKGLTSRTIRYIGNLNTAREAKSHLTPDTLSVILMPLKFCVLVTRASYTLVSTPFHIPVLVRNRKLITKTGISKLC